MREALVAGSCDCMSVLETSLETMVLDVVELLGISMPLANAPSVGFCMPYVLLKTSFTESLEVFPIRNGLI